MIGEQSLTISTGTRLVQRLNDAPSFVRFACIGATGTLCDMSCMWLLVGHLGLLWLPAKVLATEVAVANNFAWNNLWTFRGHATQTPLWRRFIAFNATYLSSLLAVLAAMGVMEHLWGASHYLLYNLATIPFSLCWNYSVSRFVIWRSVAQVERQVAAAKEPELGTVPSFVL